MSEELLKLEIPYGRDGRLEGEILTKRTLAHFQPKEDVRDIASALREAFGSPVEFPMLRQACVPGDLIVLALDDETPRADAVIAMVWRELAAAGVSAEDVTILQPATWQIVNTVDPRSLLPKDVQQKITLKKHDPTESGSCGYLASTAGGDRIYLANEMIAADMVIPIGVATFDPVLGYRGEASVLYPRYSDTDAMKRAVGHGHDELTSTDSRPMRQRIDEIGWLLGTQFVVSILPGRSNGVQAVFAGQSEAVSRRVREELEENYKVHVSERAELVVIAVEEGGSPQSWEQVAAAIDVGRRVVERDGRVLVLSQLAQKRGSGLEILSQVRQPKDALKLIREAAPPDHRAATQIARATDWANVYLLSELAAEDVEDLFMIPVSTPAEAAKLLTGDETTIVIESAQNVFAACD